MAGAQTPHWKKFDLSYVGRMGRLRRWKWGLSIICAGAGVAWIAASAVRQDATIYAGGPMSGVHTPWAKQCNQCHTNAWNGLAGLIQPRAATRRMNRACLACHRTMIDHHAETAAARHQPDDPADAYIMPAQACDHCHQEHRGVDLLTTVSDDRCTTCHTDLAGLKPDTRFAGDISAFHVDHPQFRAKADNAPLDQARIRFNHQVHLKPDLRGPTGSVQLTCDNCHRSGPSATPRPYAAADAATLSERAAGKVAPTQWGPRGTTEPGALMQPIRFALHCRSCHELNVASPGEQQWENRAVPHETPEKIRIHLRGQLASYIREHPDELTPKRSDSTDLRPTQRPSAPTDIDRLSLEWIDAQLALYEQEIYSDRKTCLYCHEQEGPTDKSSLPTIAPPHIPDRWFTHASFSHEKHRVWDCLLCHGQVPTSRDTGDVLLPDIETCRSCHGPDGGTTMTDPARPGGAAYNCTFCHTYHLPPSDTIRSGKGLPSLPIR